jgi:hypothetical protein
MSARQLWLQLGIGSYTTAWLLLHKLRRAMVDPEREPLDQVQQHLEIRLAHRSPRRHHSTGSLHPNNQREKSLTISLIPFVPVGR